SRSSQVDNQINHPKEKRLTALGSTAYNQARVHGREEEASSIKGDGQQKAEPEEMLSGVVVISSKDSVQHQGVSLTMEGTVNLQLSAKSVGVFEAFYNSVKPIQILSSTIDVLKPGKLPSGKTEIPFEFPLHVKGSKVLYETYHGVFVNIQYTLRCDMRRSLLAKDLTKTCEFIVHSAPQKGKLTPSPVDFTITPETLQNVKECLKGAGLALVLNNHPVIMLPACLRFFSLIRCPPLPYLLCP
ncbi:putative Down syndrome critical region protein 3 like protein, partial [Cricetulus griseus]